MTIQKGDLEKAAHLRNEVLVGVDEVGRGCLAGPVYAAAAIIDFEKLEQLPTKTKSLIRDSKKLSSKQRVAILPTLEDICLDYSVASLTSQEIDQIGIVNSCFAAMKLALKNLKTHYDMVLVDGKQEIPKLNQPQQAIIKGDDLVYAISAASIFAKQARDSYMHLAHKSFPVYGFDKHVGYGTKYHIEALNEFGICSIHRRSFAPVNRLQ